jgi:nucleoid DNA-binding protein
MLRDAPMLLFFKPSFLVRHPHPAASSLAIMAPKVMKSMKAMVAKKGAKSITKGGLAEALSTATELKKSECSKVLNSLAEVVAKELKKTGKVTVPGIVMVKTRVKPATKAGKREVFGKEYMVKAKPARTIVKAYPVSAIKKAI